MALHALKPKYMLSEYRIEKLLGEGGFGLTYLAFDTNLEKQVAIKEYMPSEHAIRKTDSQIVAKSSSSEKVYKWGLNAFLNEAKTLAKFEDPNIVRVFRFFEANGTAYIVMEYCEGGCLIDRVSKNKHMPEAELKKIISSIVHGLQLVHNDGILHRDIKPDNIMFRLDGTPLLIDFGAARQAIGDKSRKVTTIITPGYAPLEQYSSKGSVGPWSDIYSLSAVAYLCLTGERPPDIMNRLHDDTIIKLSDKKNSSHFLRSIDLGLELQIDDRPQNLSDWSSAWSDYGFAKSINKTPPPKPIYANNYYHSQQNSDRPISTRTSQADEMTIVNSDSIRPQNKSSSGLVKFLLTIIFLIIIAGGGYFGYDYYNQQQIKKQQIADELAQKAEETKQLALKQSREQKELVLEVQQILNQLNYKVPENGVIDTRTTESIKIFEKNNQLIITGTADAILLKELRKVIQVDDNKIWEKILVSNTIADYENYLKSFPNGIYAVQVPVLIEEIKKQQLANAQKLVQEEQQKQLLIKQQAEKIAKQQALELANIEEQKRLAQITIQKNQLIKDIQLQLIRLKFKNLKIINTATARLDDKLDKPTKNAILAYQKLKKTEAIGLPTKTLLFQLKSESKWPGRLAGETFKDCADCPTMIVIPAGRYMMGSNNGKDNEKPPHNVNIKEFILATTEVTFSQWNACVSANICTQKPENSTLANIENAINQVNMADIQEYIKWLNSQTSKTYRLVTEAEWEYAARAGTTTNYSWGDDIGENNANCDGCNSTVVTSQSIVKSFPANAYGLYDMHGNVWEWTADCWHHNYYGAPSDGEAWEPNDCKDFVVRGGSTITNNGNTPQDLRSSNRGVMNATKRITSLGFRVAMDSD